MENFAKSNENIRSNEVMPLDQARFLDRLDPEYEEQWDSLVLSAIEMKLTLKEFVMPLWKDESFPAVIRDRAMLLLIGKESVGEWKGDLGVHPFFQMAGHKPDIDGVDAQTDEFKKWLDDALEYGDVIKDRTLYKLSYDYFSRGDWDQERFDRTLERFDPNDVQWVWVDPFDEYGGIGMLPYIDDIRNGKTASKGNKKMQKWADEKYELYVQNFITNEEVLPIWLQNLSSSVIKNIVQREYKKVVDDEKLPVNIVAAYEKYFIGFYDGFSVEQYEFMRDRASILKHLGEFSQSAIRSYLQIRYEDAIRRYGSLTRDDEGIILSYITEPLPDKFNDFMDRMDKKRAEESEARAEWLEKEKENRNEREKARVISEKRRKEEEVKVNDAKVAYQAAKGILVRREKEEVDNE